MTTNEVTIDNISDITDVYNNTDVTDEDTTTDSNSITSTFENRAKSSATRKIILEANFIVTPAKHSTSGSEDEVNEIALIIDENSKTAFHTKTDLCGPYENDYENVDPDSGHIMSKYCINYNIIQTEP